MKFDNVKRHFNSKRKGESLGCRNFKSFIEELFDICSCSCYKPNSNAIKTIDFDSVGHLKCRCDIKIPLDELNFYLDQKSTRLLFISNNVDLNGSVEMRIRLERDERKQARQQLQLELIQGNSTCQNNDSHRIPPRKCKYKTHIFFFNTLLLGVCFSILISSSLFYCQAFQNDTNESPVVEYGPIKTVYNTRSYPTLVAAANRFGIGKNGAAELGNALLQDMGNFE